MNLHKKLLKERQLRRKLYRKNNWEKAMDDAFDLLTNQGHRHDIKSSF